MVTPPNGPVIDAMENIIPQKICEVNKKTLTGIPVYGYNEERNNT